MIVLFATPALAADSLNDFHVQEYVERGQHLIGAPVSVYGRLSVFNRTELRFRNCPVPFRSTIGVLTIPDKVRTVMVTGQTILERTSPGVEKRVFLIASIKPHPDDAAEFSTRMIGIKRNDFEGYYKLAAWAEARGKFYEDRELLARADEAYLRGVQLERATLSATRPEGLLELADRLAERHFPAAIRAVLHHEYLVKKAAAARKAAGDERTKRLAAVLADVKRLLPDSSRTLPVVDSKFEAAYRKDPQKTYEDSEAEGRRQLHRYLFVEIQEELLQPKADGSDNFEIAQQIDELIPERHARAEALRAKALAAQAAEVGKLNRGEMLDLAKQYRARGENAAADHVIESWLTLRRQALQADDLEGLMALAEQYRDLLRQPATADRLLIEAARKHPQAKPLADRLEALEYKAYGGTWVTEAEYNARPEAEQDRALREGRVTPGMTPAQVRQVHGNPNSIARSVTRGQVNEVWTIRLADGSKLLIQFTRFAFKGGDAVVTSTIEDRD